MNMDVTDCKPRAWHSNWPSEKGMTAEEEKKGEKVSVKLH